MFMYLSLMFDLEIGAWYQRTHTGLSENVKIICKYRNSKVLKQTNNVHGSPGSPAPMFSGLSNKRKGEDAPGSVILSFKVREWFKGIREWGRKKDLFGVSDFPTLCCSLASLLCHKQLLSFVFEKSSLLVVRTFGCPLDSSFIPFLLLLTAS